MPAAARSWLAVRTAVFLVAAGATDWPARYFFNNFDRTNLILGHFHEAAPGVNGPIVEDILMDAGTTVTAFFDPDETALAGASFAFA